MSKESQANKESKDLSSAPPTSVHTFSGHPYELTIVLKRGTVNGGGLPNASHVITSIDGREVNKSLDSSSPPQWNQTIIKSFAEIERPVDPIMIGFSLYKKRWTSSGYKLVGSMHFPLSDLIPHLNSKDPIEKELDLNINRRNISLAGKVYATFHLKEVDRDSNIEDGSTNKKEPFTWKGYHEKWVKVLFSSKYLISSIILTLIHDFSDLIEFIFSFENSYLSELIKTVLFFGLIVYIYYNYQNVVLFKGEVDSISNEVERLTNLASGLKFQI
jgi:hypothetical protein